MSVPRCLSLALLQVCHAAVPSATAGDGGDAGWTALPAGFAPWPGRIRLSSQRGPLDLGAGDVPSWSAEGTHEVESAGARLRFARAVGRGTITVFIRAGSDEVTADVELSLPDLAGAVPARLSPRGSRDVAFLGIAGGGLETAQGLYDPAADRGLDFGLVDEELSIRFERSGHDARLRIEGRLPRGRDVVLLSWVDKKNVLALSPDRSGGCRGPSPSGWSLPGGGSLLIRAEEIAREAFLPPGASLEIGDGWQGKARRAFAAPLRSWLEALEGGPGGSPAAGESLRAGRLETLGFRPVLWIVPHGQGERRVFDESPRAFVRDEDGSAVPSRFLGAYVVDGTSPEGKEYLRKLFARLRSSGCRAIRIAGLGEALGFYAREQAKLSVPAPPIEIVRATLRAARAGAGEDALLLGDVDTPLDLAGELDAARPTVPAGEAFEPLGLDALAAARGYRFHASAWWAECLPVERWEAEGSTAAASSRIAFAALTGRGLVVNATEPLPEWSREPLLRAWPPLAVRPLDLFPLDGTPRVWDLKVGGGGAGGDIAGVFNWSAVQSAVVDLSPRDLGIARASAADRMLFFDLSSESFAGATAGNLDVFLLPGHSRLFALRRDVRRPQVIAASVHALGGAGLLEDVAWSEERLELGGRLAVPRGAAIRGTPRLHIAAGRPYRALRAEASGMPARMEERGGHVIVSLPEPADGLVPFGVTFERALEPGMLAGSGVPEGLEVRFAGEERKPLISWRGVAGGLDGWRSIDGFAVLRDGEEVGRTHGTSFLDRGASFGATYRYSVKARPWSGPGQGESQVGGLESAVVDFTVPSATDAFLDAWCPASHGGQRAPVLRRSAVGGPISMGGRRFARGIGVHAPSKIEYLIEGAFEAFEAVPGVDDAARFGGSVVFSVQVDGVERFRSRVVRGGPEEPEPLRVSITGGRVLALIVEEAGDGTEGDFADWGGAKVIAVPAR